MRIRHFILLVVFLAQPIHAENPPMCELYAPGHFGNWYEVAGEREMREILNEARHWGYNRYGDWFDTLDCTDPFAQDRQYDLANALWDQKKAHFLTAQSIGLETDLVITPNHVYRDQLKPQWLATTGQRVFGQLICPHKAGAREAILDDYRNLFKHLADAGVRLTALTPAPYDYGGCRCDQCEPWILTFAELACDIHHIAREYHPGIDLHFIGWWWEADEHRLFADWMDHHAPNLASTMALHIPYGKTSVADVPLPMNCQRHAFVHIGYADQAHPRDVYGKTGPVIALHRLEATVRDLKAQSVTGVVAYSEGIFDDVNKALLGGLFTGRYTSGDEVVKAYARRYLSADDEQARQWLDWLEPWGQPFAHDARSARQAFSRLSGDPLAWRRRQWELKTDMFVAHQAISAETEWSARRLAQVEEFWAHYETLNRKVYGTGPLRHILGPTHIGLPWYNSWSEHQRAIATRPGG